MAASFRAEERIWLTHADQAEPSGLPMIDLVLNLGVRQIFLYVLVGIAIYRPLFKPFLIFFQVQHFLIFSIKISVP